MKYIMPGPIADPAINLPQAAGDRRAQNSNSMSRKREVGWLR
jgi:hypothetical protein